MCWQAGKQTGRGGAALPSWAPGARHSAVSGSVSQHNHAASHAALSPKRPHAARRAARVRCKTAPGVARLPARNHCGNRHRGRSFTIDSTPLRAREQENKESRRTGADDGCPLLPCSLFPYRDACAPLKRPRICAPCPGRFRAEAAASERLFGSTASPSTRGVYGDFSNSGIGVVGSSCAHFSQFGRGRKTMAAHDVTHCGPRVYDAARSGKSRRRPGSPAAVSRCGRRT